MRREKVLPKSCFLIGYVGHGLNFVQETCPIWDTAVLGSVERFRLDATMTLKQAGYTYERQDHARLISRLTLASITAREARDYELHKILVSPRGRLLLSLSDLDNLHRRVPILSSPLTLAMKLSLERKRDKEIYYPSRFLSLTRLQWSNMHAYVNLESTLRRELSKTCSWPKRIILWLCRCMNFKRIWFAHVFFN